MSEQTPQPNLASMATVFSAEIAKLTDELARERASSAEAARTLEEEKKARAEAETALSELKAKGVGANAGLLRRTEEAEAKLAEKEKAYLELEQKTLDAEQKAARAETTLAALKGEIMEHLCPALDRRGVSTGDMSTLEILRRATHACEPVRA